MNLDTPACRNSNAHVGVSLMLLSDSKFRVLLTRISGLAEAGPFAFPEHPHRLASPPGHTRQVSGP